MPSSPQPQGTAVCEQACPFLLVSGCGEQPAKSAHRKSQNTGKIVGLWGGVSGLDAQEEDLGPLDRRSRAGRRALGRDGRRTGGWLQ